MERNTQTYRHEDIHPDTLRRIREIKRETDRLSGLKEINTHKQRDRQTGRQADCQAGK